MDVYSLYQVIQAVTFYPQPLEVTNNLSIQGVTF